MIYPMKCPECGFTTESRDVPIKDGPPAMACLMCALGHTENGSGRTPRWVMMRRVFSPVAAVFRGGGWASKS